MKNLLNNLIGVMSPFSLLIMRGLRGQKVGTDDFNNTYYVAGKRPGYKQERRLVFFAKGYDSSHVPPEWHGWLHHQTDVIPSNTGLSTRKPWQLPGKPNKTGTSLAYRPPGHILSGNQRDKATGDYTAWRPQSKRNNAQ